MTKIEKLGIERAYQKMDEAAIVYGLLMINQQQKSVLKCNV